MNTILAAITGIPNIYDATQQAAATSDWNSLINAMGQSPSMYLTYMDETHPLSSWIDDVQWQVASWKATPWLVNVIPNISIPMTLAGDNADADFKAIAAGKWDTTITGIINTWAAAGYRTLYLRPGWEMNGEGMLWNITPANAADFVAAFQRIAAVAHSSSTASVQIVWCPGEGDYNATPAPVSSYYPGNHSVDIIGIDTYGQPVDFDTTPLAAATSPSDYTLKTALSMAKSNGKPFALGETGSASGIFPDNLAATIAASGVPVSYVALWDAAMPGFSLEWSNTVQTAAAWKAAFSTIGAASQAISSGSGGGGNQVTPNTLSLTLSGDAYRGSPTFIAKLDGKQVAGATAVTSSRGLGQTDTFTFTGTWGNGPHDLEIDFTNDLYRGPGRDRNLYVDGVKYDGVAYVQNEIHLYSNTAIHIRIGQA